MTTLRDRVLRACGAQVGSVVAGRNIWHAAEYGPLLSDWDQAGFVLETLAEGPE